MQPLYATCCGGRRERVNIATWLGNFLLLREPFSLAGDARVALGEDLGDGLIIYAGARVLISSIGNYKINF